jgi:hypothetical protein
MIHLETLAIGALCTAIAVPAGELVDRMLDAVAFEQWPTGWAVSVVVWLALYRLVQWMLDDLLVGRTGAGTYSDRAKPLSERRRGGRSGRGIHRSRRNIERAQRADSAARPAPPV